ncbi:MAG: hypothetical protein HGGPFJEG_00071 [Ignavibacteria bacterium]|nr:hypothetical protein [Ignavibacteria bacterium]
MIKKIIFIPVLIYLLSISLTTLHAQNTHWSTLDYSYSKGPVSPEYQFNYRIIITEDRNGILVYTNSSSTKDYNFKVGKSTFKKIKKQLTACDVFSVNPDEMKSDKNLIGGPISELTVTMWQPPDVDAKPTMIVIPSQLNEKYSESFNKLYDLLENSVPNSIWEKARMQ